METELKITFIRTYNEEIQTENVWNSLLKSGNHEPLKLLIQKTKEEEKQFLESLNKIHLHETLINTLESLYPDMPEEYLKLQNKSSEFIENVLSKCYLYYHNQKIRTKILKVFPDYKYSIN